MSDKQDQAICKALATDADLNRVLDDKLINLPDPPEPPPIDYDAMSLVELLDDLEWALKRFYYDDGSDVEGDIKAARARVDARLTKLGLL